MNDVVHVIVNDVIEAAMAQYPWDAGYRVDLYLAVAEALNDLADGLKEFEDSGPCAGT